MPLDFGQLGYVDQLVWQVTNAVQGGGLLADKVPLKPTLDPGFAGVGSVPRPSAPAASGPSAPLRGLVKGAGQTVEAWTSAYSNGYIPQRALTPVPGTGFLMMPRAGRALSAMINAARADGIDLSIGNTYRDYQLQAQLYRDYQAGNRSAPVAPPGQSQHGWGLAVDLSSVGAGSPQFMWLYRNAGRFGFTNPWLHGKSTDTAEPWHWEFGQGNVTAGGGGGAPPRRTAVPSVKRPPQRKPLMFPLGQYADVIPTGMGALNSGGVGGLPLAGIVRHLEARPSEGEATAGSFSNSKNGSIEQQLYKGFMDAGRQDLAKMVGTKDFTTWINAESGWNPSAISPANNQGLPNYGLFQFWAGHPWTKQYVNGAGDWVASAYTQAKLVAQYFKLTPADIRTYASQIRTGQYNGWG